MATHQKELPNGSPIPQELCSRLAELHMLRRQRKNGPWEPTAYGRSLGLVRPTGGGPLFAVPDRTKLDEALAWSQAPKIPELPLSWAQTMESASQGLLCNGSRAAGAAAALGSMPLKQLMADDSVGFHFLRKALNLGEDATYQEAAGAVYRLCMNTNLAQNNSCWDLLFTLAQPFFRTLNTMQFPVR